MAASLLMSTFSFPFPLLPPPSCVAIPPLLEKMRSYSGDDDGITNSENRERRKHHRELVGGRRWAVMTAEKARLLRKELRATECWLDVMYRSAVAARLASPDDVSR